VDSRRDSQPPTIFLLRWLFQHPPPETLVHR
jgi:hypothetical protein